MAKRIELLTPRDFEAFVDGELSGERLAAVCERLTRDTASIDAVGVHSRQRDALRSARQKIFNGDPQLAAEISRLLKKTRSLQSVA